MPKRNEVAKIATQEPKPRKNAKAQAATKKPPRISPSGYQLPEPIPAGEILTDVFKKEWRLGKSIGVGGFGEIYTASDQISKNVPADAPYVVKIEPHNNGPLFTEMHFYQRVCKPEIVEEYKQSKRLKVLGIPKFISFGSHELNGARYRFMVMERFGDDLQKLFLCNKKRFSIKFVFTLALKIIDILEYIHSKDYIHADIKGSNLLLGFNNPNEVYLVDYGLACKFAVEGKHKDYLEDPRKAHDGTIEFTSRDAHVGAQSRRGDLEILGYNILQWLTGGLPWENNLKNPEYVKNEKLRYMQNIPTLLKVCFRTTNPPEAVQAYLNYVKNMDFKQEPNYVMLRKLFSDGLKAAGYPNDGKLDLTIKKTPIKRKAKGSQEEVSCENVELDSPAKQQRSGRRKPCGLAQTNRSRSKSKSQELAVKPKKSPRLDIKTKEVSIAVPTPAMLQVMQLKKDKLKQNTGQWQTAKKAPKSKCRSRSRSASRSTEDTPSTRTLRKRPLRNNSSPSSPSDLDSFVSSPDLF